MADNKIAYQASQSFTMHSSFDTLASSATAGVESTAVDNTSNLFLDALVTIGFQIANSSPANDKAVYVYAYGSENGTDYHDPVTGTAAAITLRDPTNLPLIGVIAVPTANLLYKKTFSVAQAFGGILPRKFGVVVRNYTGQAFITGTKIATYSGVYATS